MTWGWPALAGLVVGSYALKSLGLVVLGDRRVPARVEELLSLLPAALFGALIIVSTFASDRSLVIDARAAGLAAAAITVWRRAGVLVVVVAAAGTTALVRAIS